MKEESRSTSALAVAEQFVRAFSERSEGDLRKILAPHINFRGLTPDDIWQATDLNGTIDILLGSWLEESDHVEAIISCDAHRFVDRIGLRYRLRVRNGAGVFVVEQQAYLTCSADGLIDKISIVCSGLG